MQNTATDKPWTECLPVCVSNHPLMCCFACADAQDSLDALVCLHARAEVQDDSLRISITGNDGRQPQQPQQRKASSGGGAAAAASTAGDAVYPVYVVNDVNLLQVLDTVKLMMDY